MRPNEDDDEAEFEDENKDGFHLRFENKNQAALGRRLKVTVFAKVSFWTRCHFRVA